MSFNIILSIKKASLHPLSVPCSLFNRLVRFASLMLFLSNANQLFFFCSLCSGSYRWQRTRQLQRGETAHTSLFHFCVSATLCNSFFLLVPPPLQTSSPPDSASPCSTFGSSAGSSLCQTHFSAFLFVRMWRTIKLVFRRAKSHYLWGERGSFQGLKRTSDCFSPS